MLILNGIIHTMDGETIDSGFVQVKGTRIQEVGHMSKLPPGAELDQVIDARGGHVLPGLLDIHCHLGLYGTGTGWEGDDLNEATNPCTPQLRALDGVNPLDPDFREARRTGVTCVLTGPGSTNPISGQSVLLKTSGRIADQMVVRSPAAMKFALGENPKGAYRKGPGPMTRMATAALIRENLKATGLEKAGQVVQGDAISFLSGCRERFGVIFLDPPYQTQLLEQTLELVSKIDILSEHGIMICESPAERELPPLAPPYEKGREYRYGRIKLTVYRRQGSDPRP